MSELCFQIIDEYEEYEDLRIDKCLAAVLEDQSRSYLQKLIKEDQVQVNDKTVKANYCLRAGDSVHITIPEAVEPDILAEDIPLDILYEDEDVLVVNKPKGMVSHPAAGHYSGTLVNAVMYHCRGELSGINGVMRPGIVHRIDMDTTGSVIICKNDYAHASIALQLKEHTITRRYMAVVHGRLKEPEGTIDAPIGRSDNDRKKMAVTANGRHAITHYRVLEQYNESALVECVLETGRTHQIRVHMASIGHPLMGDEAYSNRKSKHKLQGQALHAYILGFVHPRSGAYIETMAPIPEYLSKLISDLKNN